MWAQIVGKVRMTLSPPLNHWWHVALYVNSRGLTTGPIPYAPGVFEIQFDFQKHELHISTSEGPGSSRPLRDESVASFHSGILEALASLGIAVRINLKPQEVLDAVPFDRDYANCSYDPEYANRLWRILVSSAKVLQRFRAQFLGKCSPVHFFWGSFDLACTRFSGRPAPARKGAISGPAYSHEVSSAGFWPGGGGVDGPAFYSYTVPQPPGMETQPVRPNGASWNTQLSEFILMYDDVRLAESPEETVFEFLESTYDAGARLAQWDCARLEI
jgi:sugar/nucleoside kinase (ribokinase family)